MIHYTYTASGAKISQQLIDDGRIGEERRYMGPFVFSGNSLSWVNLPQGRIAMSIFDTLKVEYHLRDHLGNTRITLVETETGDSYTVHQDVSYYPFGMTIEALSYTAPKRDGTPANRYLYNGKELQDDFELNWGVYPAIGGNYGARFYDAQIGRWHSVDPLAEKYINISPYAYVANNPILFIDPDGQKIVIANNTSKALTNLAMIAATSKGRQRLNRLISSRHTYTARSTFWSSSSAYDGNGEIGRSRTAYYVGSAWRPSVGGGAMSSMYAMGHELNHAYDHDITGSAGNKDRKSRERSSVNFTNYLRSVHGDGDDMRTSYSGLGLGFSSNENVYNSQNEKVTDFTQTLDISFGGNTVMGFSYNTSTNGQEATTSYTISLKTESGQYAYRVFDNKKDYDAAVERIQNLKKNEDEKE